MIHHRDNVSASVEFIRKRIHTSPRIGLILGSGLGDFADTLPNATFIGTSSIPNYPGISVEGHKGRLLFAKISEHDLLAFQGRVHFYESNDLQAVLYPIRVAQELGVHTLIVTNAAGGVNRSFAPGDLMVISDQINLTMLHLPQLPDSPGPSSTLYSERLTQLALRIGTSLGLLLKKGVYAGMLGPSYETASEIEMIYRLGGDAVGMSTVMEVDFASRLGMEVLGISCITNRATGTSPAKLSHIEVTEVANRVKKDFALLLSSIVKSL